MDGNEAAILLRSRLSEMSQTTFEEVERLKDEILRMQNEQTRIEDTITQSIQLLCNHRGVDPIKSKLDHTDRYGEVDYTNHYLKCAVCRHSIHISQDEYDNDIIPERFYDNKTV